MYEINTVYCDGRFLPTHGTERLELINPTTEAPMGTVLLADEQDAANAILSAARAFPSMSRSSKTERIEMLECLAEAVRTRAEDLTEATILEYGGPIEQAKWRAGLAARNFAAAAGLLRDFSFAQRINDVEVIGQALGVTVHIVPWNSVYNAISVKLAGALAAGCTVVVKPSEYSALQNQLFTECLHAAGVPAGAVNVVTGRGEVVGEALTGDPRVRKISFTGSNAVGKAILRKSADRLVRVTLELGGKAPTLVMPDADLRKAAAQALAIAFANNGQACIAGTRALVQREQVASFCAAIRGAAANIIVGDPAQKATTMGPLVNRRQYDRVQSYIRRGIEEGAHLLIGGEGRPDGLDRGYFAKPTVFTQVKNDMTIAREEIFGPVLCVIAYEDLDEAIAIANDTPFGLHAYVLGEDIDLAKTLAGRIDAGRVAINGLVHEPLAPFGGFKESGIGREYGIFGIEDHLELKAIAIAS